MGSQSNADDRAKSWPMLHAAERIMHIEDVHHNVHG